MHEVVQYSEVEVHADLVEYRFEPGVERFAVLRDDQGGPDGAQTLGRLGRAYCQRRSRVVVPSSWTSSHSSRAYRAGPTHSRKSRTAEARRQR